MGELDSSELGTLEYWESSYKQEIKNFHSRGDPGEIWFGEDIVERLVKWMERSVGKDSTILDLGCGNGMLLVELCNVGYKKLHGVDYSENAVNLARTIMEKYDLDIKYEVADVLEGLKGVYDVVLDKGTYDAVSLSQGSKENRLRYITNVSKCLKPDGLFVITSCNWTLEELNEHFIDTFSLLEVIPTPQFKFGGKVGNVVTSGAYKKKN